MITKRITVALGIVLILGGSTLATSPPLAVTYDSCPTYETLHHSKPYCEPTCVQDCSQPPARNQFLIYDPTCVCVEGYVRHEGKCISKQQCPPPPPPPEEPCEIVVHSTPKITKAPYQPTPKPPCSKPKQYAPCRTILYHRFLKPKRTKSYKTVTAPPYKPTTPVPYKPTNKPYPPPTIRPPPPPPPKKCSACEQLVLVAPCCEPTCENDCSSVSCPMVLVAPQPTCACQPGLVRHQGHCIEPSACPRSVSRYRLYAPVGTVCAQCNGNLVQYGHRPAEISAVPAEYNEDHFPSYLPD